MSIKDAAWTELRCKKCNQAMALWKNGRDSDKAVCRTCGLTIVLYYRQPSTSVEPRAGETRARTLMRELRCGLVSAYALQAIARLLSIAEYVVDNPKSDEKDSHERNVVMRWIREVGAEVCEPDTSAQTRIDNTANATWGNDDGR